MPKKFMFIALFVLVIGVIVVGSWALLPSNSPAASEANAANAVTTNTQAQHNRRLVELNAPDAPAAKTTNPHSRLGDLNQRYYPSDAAKPVGASTQNQRLLELNNRLYPSAASAPESRIRPAKPF